MTQDQQSQDIIKRVLGVTRADLYNDLSQGFDARPAIAPNPDDAAPQASPVSLPPIHIGEETLVGENRFFSGEPLVPMDTPPVPTIAVDVTGVLNGVPAAGSAAFNSGPVPI